MPMKVGGGAKQNVSLKQDVQVSSATQREATTIMHCHTKKLSEDTFLHLHHDQKKEGGMSKLPHKSKIWHLKGLHNLLKRVWVI